jgi:hypothetical protein
MGLILKNINNGIGRVRLTFNAPSAPPSEFDPDALAYLEAVEEADGQALESAVRAAINDFVVGCKTDGIWDAIKASCILAGARTLYGALVPLAGDAPTNFNFVSGDYDRTTGLKGDGSTKYLDSNRADNADPQNDAHVFAHVITADTRFNTTSAGVYIGGSSAGFASRRTAGGPYSNSFYTSNRSGAAIFSGVAANSTGGMGTSRSSSTGYSIRVAGTSGTRTVASVSPGSQAIFIFADNANGTVQSQSDARLAFYSIGESLDLALLDTRVSNLITAIGAAIP